MKNYDINSFFEANQKEYYELRKNKFLEIKDFFRFFHERGMNFLGFSEYDISYFVNNNWINLDENYKGSNKLHPFRFYPIYLALKFSKLKISASSSLYREDFKDFIIDHCENFLPPITNIKNEFFIANEIINLAILLEPIYWQKIVSKVTYMTTSSTNISVDDFQSKLQNYKKKINLFTKQLDPIIWEKYHRQLRHDASELDDNHDLYLLLRTSPWDKRQSIQGHIGLALWIRHIAELLRLGFEDAHNCIWEEEDCSFGNWNKKTRKLIFGSERPVDNTSITKPYLAFRFGLHTGSVTRWYLEGETEYFAAQYALPNAKHLGIELINLKGAVGNERANAALRLTDNIINDLELRRFSYISFDSDVSANLRAIKKLVENNNVVGYVNCNHPDFEFSNFTINELIKIIINMDRDKGYDTKELEKNDYLNIKSDNKLEEYYKKFSKNGQKGLKGNNWGKYLAQYALEHLAIDKNERPFITTLKHILHSPKTLYEIEKENYKIIFKDPHYFERINIHKMENQ